MKKIIVEAGSTVTKIDEYDGEEIHSLGNLTILFKKNYQKEKQLKEEDIKQLIQKIKELKSRTKDIFVCGTSVFRNLTEQQKKDFINRFKEETDLSFHIISPEKENELTVIGATQKVDKKVAVFVGGGGSSEIAISENGKIIETKNTPMGVIDIMQEYPDLAEDIASTPIEKIQEEIEKKLQIPEEKADILILAGGGHLLFAKNSGISYERNTLYQDELQPVMMTIENRKKDSKKYFETISLDEIRNRVEDSNWWFATRAMCAFVLVVAEKLGAKYIVPTDISMVYGIIEEMKKEEENE